MLNNTGLTATRTGRRLREVALVAHSLPHVALEVRFRDGRTFSVSPHPSALMTPCLFRRAVIGEIDRRGATPWLTSISDVDIIGPQARELALGLYATSCAGTGVVGFVSGLPTGRLVEAIAELPGDDAVVRIVPDVALGLNLIAVEATTPHAVVLHDAARRTQSAVLVAEIESGVS